MMPAENSEALFGEIPGRFVVLEHRVPRAFVRQEEIASSESPWVADASRVTQGDHFDLMFESRGVLQTWAMDRIPDSTPQIAWQLPEHRIEYLEYEGLISGDRGSVTRVISGTYERVAESPKSSDRFTLRLSGCDATDASTEVHLLRFQRESGQQWTVARI